MATSGVSGYAAISARVRAMNASRLGPQVMEMLSETADFAALVGGLKQTAYRPYLESLKDKDITPRRVILKLKAKLADAYTSVIHMAPGHIRPLLTQLYRYYEVDNLKAVLRGIVTDPNWERIQDVLFPFGSLTVLPAQAMVEAGNVATAVELLRGTAYENILSFAMKRYSAEQTLFPLEVALDLDYWRQLWKQAKQLQGEDRAAALRVVGSLIDMNNLMWAIRYRVYHQLSEEELINYTLSFGFHVHDEDIRAIAAGADLSSVVGHIYPDVADLNTILEDAHSGLPKLEIQLQRQLMKQCMAAFTGNPFHAGLPLAFLILCGLEVRDLVVLIEAKSSQMAGEDFRPYVLNAAMDQK